MKIVLGSGFSSNLSYNSSEESYHIFGFLGFFLGLLILQNTDTHKIYFLLRGDEDEQFGVEDEVN